MTTEHARQAELAKYTWAYEHQPKYRCKNRRLADSVADLTGIPCRGAYLDVSCGRGEMLDVAAKLGFGPVQGTEIVPALIDGTRVVHAWAHGLPFADKSFDVVSFLDVMEHLIVGDDERACREIARVTRRFALLTVSNLPSHNKRGDDLHINKRPYEEWLRLFGEWFKPGTVTWNRAVGRRSECFLVKMA